MTCQIFRRLRSLFLQRNASILQAIMMTRTQIKHPEKLLRKRITEGGEGVTIVVAGLKEEGTQSRGKTTSNGGKQ
jgi:hypothetical protein